MGPAAPGAPPVGRWLAELDIEVLEHGERDGVHSWDIRRDLMRAGATSAPRSSCRRPWPASCGCTTRRRSVTASASPTASCCTGTTSCPSPSSPWGADERLILATELAPGALDRDALGAALARLTAICDLLRDESASWIWPSGAPPSTVVGPASAILERYAVELGDLVVTPDGDP